MSLVLDDIKNFTIVCETLNISRASEVLGVSQPTLSYSVKRLEREIGNELIVRLKNGVQLTKTGEEFSKKAKLLIQNWEDAQNILCVENEDVTGEFSIGVHPSVAIYTLNPLFDFILDKYPKLNFQLIHGLSREIAKKVINWEIDFGIVINPIQHPDLVIKELGKDLVTLFEAKGSKRKLIFDPALAQSQYVLKNLKKSSLNLDGHIHSGNLEVIASLASAGIGIGLLPSRVAANRPNLKAVKGAPSFKDKICLVYRKEKHTNTVSRKIIEKLREYNI